MYSCLFSVRWPHLQTDVIAATKKPPARLRTESTDEYLLIYVLMLRPYHLSGFILAHIYVYNLQEINPESNNCVNKTVSFLKLCNL